MYREFSALLAVWLPALALALVLFGVSFILVPRRLDSEKLSAYECGFDPFEDARGRFDVRFYLVAILFIVFDLEVSFLFPWSLVVGGVDLFGYVTLLLFLLVLTLGFLYEWFRGALDWLIFFLVSSCLIGRCFNFLFAWLGCWVVWGLRFGCFFGNGSWCCGYLLIW